MPKCAICKSKNSESKNKSTKHKHPTINKILAKLCGHCKKKALSRLGVKPSDKAIKELYAIVNGLLTSAEVRQIRKNLNLTQKDAALICGGGPNAFSRYERGEKVPIRATSNLLRLLNKYPNEVEYLLKLSY